MAEWICRMDMQNGYAEGLIGSVGREWLGLVIVYSERHLRHILRFDTTYFASTSHRARSNVYVMPSGRLVVTRNNAKTIRSTRGMFRVFRAVPTLIRKKPGIRDNGLRRRTKAPPQCRWRPRA